MNLKKNSTRFLDANIFIYAYYKPKRELTNEESEMKNNAKKIIKRINEGENVLTTVVHVSEVSNILKKALPLDELYSLLIGLYSLDNVKIVGVTEEDYLGALELMKELKMDPNDCLAVATMRRKGINEIYTFDKGFEAINEVKKIP